MNLKEITKEKQLNFYAKCTKTFSVNKIYYRLEMYSITFRFYKLASEQQLNRLTIIHNSN